MSTVECDATFHTSYHTLHNIVQQLLRQFIPFLYLENALAIRDVEYPRCLDNPEQRVFDDMLRVVVHKNKFITDSTTEKEEHEEVELHQCIVGQIVIGPFATTCMRVRPLIMMPAHTMIPVCRISVPFPGYFLDDKQYHSRARSVGVYNPMTD
ncbi:hypothetical protein TNCV_2921111 [Trichonephila clavipes]|nr:hypothetical protein TNCV_2921111 [Trichonephila clavipes]